MKVSWRLWASPIRCRYPIPGAAAKTACLGTVRCRPDECAHRSSATGETNVLGTGPRFPGGTVVPVNPQKGRSTGKSARQILQRIDCGVLVENDRNSPCICAGHTGFLRDTRRQSRRFQHKRVDLPGCRAHTHGESGFPMLFGRGARLVRARAAQMARIRRVSSRSASSGSQAPPEIRR